ncbi:hypothetical protein [Thermovibrio ammonificans]|uniref:Uncharacterized protein n=1 Tax=Thermovibrio ammonificans (strain DSM 15698 / JCM 12110 / HB-1) TaxID=648996 RepID=E8T2F2_THEA1|nr:hypothetical protein [Thermovibrio ammonificans]ADU97047.1 hypothetical protein Theam_1080 [Thermovibrio ammonificans HB-1]
MRLSRLIFGIILLTITVCAAPAAEAAVQFTDRPVCSSLLTHTLCEVKTFKEERVTASESRELPVPLKTEAVFKGSPLNLNAPSRASPTPAR